MCVSEGQNKVGSCQANAIERHYKPRPRGHVDVDKPVLASYVNTSSCMRQDERVVLLATTFLESRNAFDKGPDMICNGH